MDTDSNRPEIDHVILYQRRCFTKNYILSDFSMHSTPAASHYNMGLSMLLCCIVWPSPTGLNVEVHQTSLFVCFPANCIKISCPYWRAILLASVQCTNTRFCLTFNTKANQELLPCHQMCLSTNSSIMHLSISLVLFKVCLYLYMSYRKNFWIRYDFPVVYIKTYLMSLSKVVRSDHVQSLNWHLLSTSSSIQQVSHRNCMTEFEYRCERQCITTFLWNVNVRTC